MDVAWDLGEMGSAQRKGAREGRAPQTEGEISSLAPARKEAPWSRKKKGRRARHDDKEPACTERALLKDPCVCTQTLLIINNFKY